MIRNFMILTALVAIPVLIPAKAQAQTSGEEYCREYVKEVYIGGRTEEAYGTACYRPDGSWEIVDLEGSEAGKTQVRSVIQEDIRAHYPRAGRVIVSTRNVLPRYYHSKRYYNSRSRHNKARYKNQRYVTSFGFPSLNVVFYDRDNKRSYNKGSQRNNCYDNRRNHR